MEGDAAGSARLGAGVPTPREGGLSPTWDDGGRRSASLASWRGVGALKLKWSPVATADSASRPGVELLAGLAFEKAVVTRGAGAGGLKPDSTSSVGDTRSSSSGVSPSL
jgi:hypothetical protein